MTRFLVLNGPNLNMLGTREPEIYGARTLDDLMDEVREYARMRKVDVEVYTSNCEGKLIEQIQAACGRCQGIVFNPAAYTHYSYALRDAVACATIPVVEVHLSDITTREDFRKVSVIAPVCVAQCAGDGVGSYKAGIDALIERSRQEEGDI